MSLKLAWHESVFCLMPPAHSWKDKSSSNVTQPITEIERVCCYHVRCNPRRSIFHCSTLFKREHGYVDMLKNSRQWTAFWRSSPTNDSSLLTRRINWLFGQTNRLNAFGKRHWLSQPQQSDVVIISVLIKVSMPNNCTDCPLNCFCLGRYKLVVIAKNHSNFASL